MTTCNMTIAASSSKTLRWKSSTSTSALFSLLKFWWHNILLIGIVSICQWHCPNHGHHYHHYFALSEWWKTKSGEKILRCVSNNTPSCGNLHRWVIVIVVIVKRVNRFASCISIVPRFLCFVDNIQGQLCYFYSLCCGKCPLSIHCTAYPSFIYNIDNLGHKELLSERTTIFLQYLFAL